MLEKLLRLALLGTALACSTNVVERYRTSVAEKVVEGSQGKRTVLVGEDHWTIEDDVIFRQNILPALAKEGYTHLVMEVDSPLQPLADKLPESMPKLREAIKEYARPDQLIQTMREAHRLGYKVHFLDDFSLHYKRDFSGRNERIANNIAQKILSKDPSAKVVGFFGAAHIPTKPFYRPDVKTVSPMGFFLSKIRREEPYTIAILPAYKAEQYIRFEGKEQSVEIIALPEHHMNAVRHLK